jgi:hypothetical protein
MTGRVIGWLMICDPPAQTAGQIAEALRASKGSISTTTRMLLRVGLIERVVKPGERRDYFRMSDDGWDQSVMQQLASVTALLPLLRQGAALIAEAPPERRARIDNIIDLYEWMEHELKPLFERRDARKHAQRGMRR